VSNDVAFNIDVRYVDGSEDRFRCESQMGSNGLYGLARRVLGTQGRCAANRFVQHNAGRRTSSSAIHSGQCVSDGSRCISNASRENALFASQRRRLCWFWSCSGHQLPQAVTPVDAK
jgi:hypothetical protein